MFKRRKKIEDTTMKDFEKDRVETRAFIEQSNRSLGPDFSKTEFRPYFNAEDYVDHKDPNKFYRMVLLTVTTLTELWEESTKDIESEIKLGPEYYMGQITGLICELNKYEKLRKEHKFEIPNLHKEAFEHAMNNNVDRYTIGDKTFLIENVKVQIEKDGSFNKGWTRRLLIEETSFQKRVSEFIKDTESKLKEQQKNLDPHDMYDWVVDKTNFQGLSSNVFELTMTIEKTGCKNCSFGYNFHKESSKNTCGEYQK